MREKQVCIPSMHGRRAFKAWDAANASVRCISCIVNLQGRKVAGDLSALKAFSAACEFDQVMLLIAAPCAQNFFYGKLSSHSYKCINVVCLYCQLSKLPMRSATFFSIQACHCQLFIVNYQFAQLILPTAICLFWRLMSASWPLASGLPTFLAQTTNNYNFDSVL